MRRRLLSPVTVTVTVLVAATLTAFIWTGSYVHSVASGVRPNGPVVAPAGPSSQLASGSSRGGALLGMLRGAVWTVRTLDGNGEPSTGSAFAVISTSGQTLLLTTYSIVTAATYQPAPDISVSQGSGTEQPVTLRSWDPAHDLALLVLGQGNQPVLQATDVTPPRSGQQVDVVSGAAGVTTEQLVDAPAMMLAGGGPSRGAPVMDVNGSLVGVDSSAYTPPSPTALAPGAHFAIPIAQACAVVLVCPGGSFPTS